MGYTKSEADMNYDNLDMERENMDLEGLDDVLRSVSLAVVSGASWWYAFAYGMSC